MGAIGKRRHRVMRCSRMQPRPSLQDVINASFARAASTEQALLLLRQFESLLASDSFRADLDAKYLQAFQARWGGRTGGGCLRHVAGWRIRAGGLQDRAALCLYVSKRKGRCDTVRQRRFPPCPTNHPPHLQRYAADLEGVQRLYEKHKADPPVARNAPPVAGKIQWARHLLHRIEAPMLRFQEREAVLAAKDSKKVFRTYNRLAQVGAGRAAGGAWDELVRQDGRLGAQGRVGWTTRAAANAAVLLAAWPGVGSLLQSPAALHERPQALLEFEGLWHQAWLRGIDNAKAQLQATLLAQDPASGAGWGRGGRWVEIEAERIWAWQHPGWTCACYPWPSCQPVVAVAATFTPTSTLLPTAPLRPCRRRAGRQL